MTATAVEQLLYQLDAAFDGEDWHSLLRNLRAVAPDEWGWVPPGGRRTIRDIVQHVGACKFMYENHAFGDASLTWEQLRIAAGAVLAEPESAIAWLNDGHTRLRNSIARLDDAELAQPRRRFSGALHETRWIIATMIQHDLYHAGEINHIRALVQGDDE